MYKLHSQPFFLISRNIAPPPFCTDYLVWYSILEFFVHYFVATYLIKISTLFFLKKPCCWTHPSTVLAVTIKRGLHYSGCSIISREGAQTRIPWFKSHTTADKHEEDPQSITMTQEVESRPLARNGCSGCWLGWRMGVSILGVARRKPALLWELTGKTRYISLPQPVLIQEKTLPQEPIL